MAYFPNGTAGLCFIEEQCANCVHWPVHEDDPGCAVDLIHNLYNYDQCANDERGKAIKSILEMLIPTTEGGLHPDQCSMFLPRADVEVDEAERRRLAAQPGKYEAAMAEARQGH